MWPFSERREAHECEIARVRDKVIPESLRAVISLNTSAEREPVEGDGKIRGQLRLVGLDAAGRRPNSPMKLRLVAAKGSQMEWIIESYDRKTDRDGTHRYTTEGAFISAAEELLRNIWKGFVSATLPDGSVLNEQQLRGLIAHSASKP